MKSMTPGATHAGRVPRALRVLALIGAAVLAVGLVCSPQRGWANVLLLSYGLVGIGLGGMFFVALQYASGAGWAVAVRRVPEAMFGGLILGGCGLLMVFLFRPSLYPWAHPEPELAHALTGFKGWWLNRQFFLLRAVCYFAMWMLPGWAIIRRSRLQDRNGDPAHTRNGVRLSVIFLVCFASTFWLASFDWIMSLEPRWCSTIFGVYNFAGCFLGALAVLALLAIRLQRHGPLRGILTAEHLHDLGKLILAFSTFWMYIWFSQYMLIWYANFPEETAYFTIRLHGAYGPLFVLNFFLNWVIPFFALLPRRAKRSTSWLAKVAVVLLVGRWLDLYLMIFPPVLGSGVHLGVLEISSAFGAAAMFLLAFSALFRSAAPVPGRDPFLAESLHYHQ